MSSSINLKKSLNSIRTPIKVHSFPKKFLYSSLALLFGIATGVLAKFLDLANLPSFLEALDLSNFFGLASIWCLFGLIVSVYSKSPLRASLNTFLFFSGMLTGYYVYTRIFAGFYPDFDYLMIWVAFTVLSPFIAVFCWYAKGSGLTSVVLSALIIGFLSTYAFTFSIVNFYFNTPDILGVLVWIAGIVVLYRNPKQTLYSVILSVLIVCVYNVLPISIPYI